MSKKTRNIQTNKSQTGKRVMIQCKTLINREAVRRESIGGVEHIIVSSSTLPDDIVMNGGLYPAEEIAKSFESLEMTFAPVEHPTIDGQFISAADPRAIHGFHAGAFNINVRRENGRVHVDKMINVAEALKSDRGKRLLDRIDELESNEKPRAIHTSVGVFLDMEELTEPQTNAAGDEFTWIARDMVFDHDAILLDSVGAAQPHQGVGVAVNKSGDKCKVKVCQLDGKTQSFDRLSALAGNQSFTAIHKAVQEALERSAINSHFIEELFEDKVVFWSGDDLFEVPFVVDEAGIATIVGIPLPVERSVTFTPKTNAKNGEGMKEVIINALKKASVETEGLSDDALLSAYDELRANQSDNDGNDSKDLAGIVANALKPVVTEIAGLKAQLNEAGAAEIDKLADIVANSGKYVGLDADSAKLLGVDKLKEMAGNCQPAFGISPVVNLNGDDTYKIPSDMPK